MSSRSMQPKPKLDEQREGALLQGLAVPVDQLARRQHRFAQACRRQQVAEAQLGEEGLGKGPEVGHLAVPVEAAQRLQRTPVEAVLAVVVVLDDQRPVALRPVQQLQAPLQAHRHAQRELVRRGDVDQLGVVRQQVDAQPLGVHRHSAHLGAGGQQAGAGRRITGFLDHRQVAGVEHHPGQQVESLLGALGDHQGVPVALHGAVDRQVAGDRQAQLGVAFGFLVERRRALLQA